MAHAKTSGLINELRGSIGGLVFFQVGDNVVIRQKVTPNNPQTVHQMVARNRQSAASRIWANLDPSVVKQWKAYAESVSMRPMNAFVSLASRVLLVNPAATVPTTPPTSVFFGDVISISVAATTGGIQVTASGANAAGVVTEILAQRIVSKNRATYAERYRHKGTISFDASHLSALVPLPAGLYAVAYRFIRASTGQITEMAELPRVTVTVGTPEAAAFTVFDTH